MNRIFGNLTVLIVAVTQIAAVLIVPLDEESIQGAIDAADDGDAIIVLAGEYEENIDFHGKAISVVAFEGAETTVIDGGGEGPCARFTSGEGLGASLIGFTLANGVAAGDGYGGGALIEGSSPMIAGNVFHDNSAEQGGAGISISFEGAAPVIYRNLFYSNTTPNSGGAVSLYQCTGFIGNNTITANTANADAGGINIPFTADVALSNNIVVSNSSGRSGAIAGWQANDAVLTYNDVWGNRGGDYGAPLQGGVGSVSEDPLFENADEFRFGLTEDSPCIDAGDPQSAADWDGSSADMGCFPYITEELPDPIALAFDSLLFNDIPIDSSSIEYFTLENPFPYALKFLFYMSEQDYFTLLADQAVVEPDGFVEVGVEFHSDSAGSFSEILTIYSLRGAGATEEAIVFFPATSRELVIQATAARPGNVPNPDSEPRDFDLLTCSPNPFNNSFSVQFNLQHIGWISLGIYDIWGNRVAQLSEGLHPAGDLSIGFQGDGLASGMYLLKLQANGRQAVRRVCLVR